MTLLAPERVLDCLILRRTQRHGYSSRASHLRLHRCSYHQFVLQLPTVGIVHGDHPPPGAGLGTGAYGGPHAAAGCPGPVQIPVNRNPHELGGFSVHEFSAKKTQRKFSQFQEHFVHAAPAAKHQGSASLQWPFSSHIENHDCPPRSFLHTSGETGVPGPRSRKNATTPQLSNPQDAKSKIESNHCLRFGCIAISFTFFKPFLPFVGS
jgi:hypothetical protein